MADSSSLKAKIKVDLKYMQNVLKQEGKNMHVQLFVAVPFEGTFFLCWYWGMLGAWSMVGGFCKQIFHQLLMRAGWAMAAHPAACHAWKQGIERRNHGPEL